MITLMKILFDVFMNTKRSTEEKDPADALPARRINGLRFLVIAVVILVGSAQWCKAQYDITTTISPTCEKLTPCNPSGSVNVAINYDTNLPINYCYLIVGVTNWVVGAYTFTTYDSGFSWTSSGFSPDYTASASLTGCGITRSSTAKPQTVKVAGTAMLLDTPRGDLPNLTWLTPSVGQASFEITDDLSGCDDGTGCSSGCNGAGGPAPLGTANVANDQGPYVSFNLGPFSTRQNSGVLLLDAKTTSASLSTPDALYVPYYRSNAAFNVDVVTNGSGVVEQINAPQGLVNVYVSNSYLYQLQMFYNSNVTIKTGGFYGTNAAAFSVWTVANPNGATNSNVLTITETRSGVTNRQFTYTLTNTSGTNIWQLTDGGGIRTVSSWQATVSDATYGTVTNCFQETDGGGNVVQMVEKSYATINGMGMLVLETDGVGTTTNITSYYYNSANLPEQILYPNGNWVLNYYDSLGRLISALSAYGDSSQPALGNYRGTPYKETDYSYDTAVSGDNATNQTYTARLEVTYLPDISGTMREVSRTYRSSPLPDEIDEYRCVNPDPGGTGDPTTNLLTRTVTYVDPTDYYTYQKVKWQLHPDQTVTMYNYQEDSSGVLTNIIVQTGVPDSTVAPTTVTDGVQTSKALNSWGQPTSVITQVITNGSLGPITSRQTITFTDDLQLDNYVVDLAGRTNQYEYACCGLESVTDPDGVVTSYTYDALKRLVATTTLRGAGAITITNTRDAADRVLLSQRIGTNGSTITLSQFQYDVLGRMITQTNALGGVTTTTNVMISGEMVVTNSNPDGGSRVESYYSDGTLKSVTGTAVRPTQYIYGTEQDPLTSQYRQYTLTVKLDASLGTNEWVKTYRDGAGQLFETVYAGASSNPYSISYYNNAGQLTNQIDPDGDSTMYAYNSKGELAYTILDMNQNGIIDWSGPDRITFTTNDVTSDNGATVHRTRTFVWSASSNSSNLISTIETSPEGLTSWNTIWNSATAITTTNITAYYPSSGLRVRTAFAPDGSFTVSSNQYRQLISTTRYDAGSNQLGRTTYGYDAHGRQSTLTDSRNGTTSNYYNNADQVSGTITAPAASGGTGQVTSNYFDNMRRTVGITQPDSTSVTNFFACTGDLLLTYGSRTYPVGYSYDAQGRMKSMTNWSDFSGNIGARVTTWTYDTYRGFLTGKTYDGGTRGPSYTYTSAGRLASRLWARGTNTTYAYDNAGSLAMVTYNDGSTPGITNGYDRCGRQTIVSNGPSVCSLVYNDQNQLLSESYSGGPLNGLTVSNVYDSLLRRTTNGLWNASSWLTQTRYTYDAASRLSTVSDGTNTAGYSYVANSPLVGQISFTNVSSLRMTTTKSFDYLNRLTSISSANDSSVVLDSHGYAYNNANQRTSVTNADNTYWIYQYDSLGQVVSGIKYWPDNTVVAGQQFGYKFDDIGNRTGTSAGGDQWGANLRYGNYSANNLNQYSTRTVPGAVDIIGVATNNSTVTVNNQPTYRRGTYYRAQIPLNNSSGGVYESVTNLAVLNTGGTNQDILTNITGNVFLPQNPENFTYDADGNLAQDGRWTYSWDAENRLVIMTSLSTAPLNSKFKLNFTYDWKSRRIQKQVLTNNSGTYTASYTTDFVYDGWNLVGEINDASGSLIRNYIWGSDLTGTIESAGGVSGLLALYDSGAAQLVCFDGNGNVSALLDATGGTVVANYDYSPFGELIRCNGPAAKSNPIRFSTEYNDNESGTICYPYRIYDPSTGRWISRDPIAEKGSLNLYEFIGNYPADGVDFLGLCCACKKVSFDSTAVSVSGNPNPTTPPSLLIGMAVNYTIEVAGDPADCKCKYVDNGPIKGSVVTKAGSTIQTSTNFVNVTTVIPCQSGHDQPGFNLIVPQHGGPITVNLNYNWTGTVECDSDGWGYPSSLSDSTSITGNFKGSIGPW